ncbi:zinc finger protein 630-like [Vanessa tameamea]|uniref:Zinc finger protein 630-like n=1 Tax=Vanessa tameamea TaxID=334116 RepID=A0A8B8HEW1_VANTA|nr:zinc finger protein 630-like [Vanessa tameamea]
MDFVKREDNNIFDEETYKMYLETLQKSHMIDTPDYQHTAISMEQLHQAMQSSLNSSSLVHNFQLPLSPRQMSTLMLKTNHITRSLNFNELPSHLPKNLTMEMELISLPNDLPHNLRHDDMLTQNLSRNLDITLARTLNNELELQNTLSHVQSLQEHELTRNIGAELNHSLSRVNDLSQNIGRDIPHELGNEIDLSHLSRQNLEPDVILSQEDSRRSHSVQAAVDSHLLEQQLVHRLEQNMALRLDQTLDRLDQPLNQRIDQTLAQRLDQNLPQRLDQTLAQRLDQRLFNSSLLHEQKLEPNEHLYSVACHIKSEQEDDGYFYDNMNQGMANTGLNGEIPQQADHSQPSSNLHHDQIYSLYNNQIPISALNPIDLYSRQQNYVQNYITDVSRENPQNLVVHRQFDNSSPYTEEFKKLRQDGEGGKKDSKIEEPKENLKPTDQNKMYYEYSNDYMVTEKNENDPSSNNKIPDELSMSIKGEYVCYKCNEVFPSKRLLKQHAKTCENGENSELEKLGKFSCSQCAYRCQSPAILKIHERTHTGEKPYACTFCDYKSGQKNNVAKHILVHMKQKPFGCQYCDYRCAQKNNLVVHERTHTGYKPFACPFCDYRTVQKPNLVKHMYLHTDQKPFSCDMCNYRCVQKTNLTKHKQRHLNEKDGDKIDTKAPIKPYKPRQKSVKCPHCSYRCVQKSSLEKHLQFKHNDLNSDIVDSDCGLNLMKTNTCDSIQNLSVKKADYELPQDKVLEPLPLQS